MAQSIRVLVAFPEALVQFLASTTQFTTVPSSSSRMSVAYIWPRFEQHTCITQALKTIETVPRGTEVNRRTATWVHIGYGVQVSSGRAKWIGIHSVGYFSLKKCGLLGNSLPPKREPYYDLMFSQRTQWSPGILMRDYISVSQKLEITVVQ